MRAKILSEFECCSSVKKPMFIWFWIEIIFKSLSFSGRLLSGHRQTSMIRFFKHWRWCTLLQLFDAPTSQLDGGGLKSGLSDHPSTSILRRCLPCRRATWCTSRSRCSNDESPLIFHLLLYLLNVTPNIWAHFFWLRLTEVWCCWKSFPTFEPDWSQISPSRLDSRSKLTNWAIKQ